jgi:hypothetical protein
MMNYRSNQTEPAVSVHQAYRLIINRDRGFLLGMPILAGVEARCLRCIKLHAVTFLVESFPF